MMANKKSSDKPFFVGYLPMPAALKRFYWPLALLLLIAAAAAGHFWAMQQQSAGEATWRPATPEVLRGVLTLRPYPALHRFHPENPGRIESVPFGRPGKARGEFAGRVLTGARSRFAARKFFAETGECWKFPR